LFLAMLALAAGLAAPALPAWGADANTLVKEGVDLRKNGNELGALKRFQEAYELAKTPRILAHMGVTEQALGRWAAADRHIREALETGKHDPWIQKNRAALQEALKFVEDHVGRLDVIGEPAGAEVLVEGEAVGVLPLPSPVRVAAGTVVVEVRAQGFIAATRVATIVAHQLSRESFSLRPAVTPAPPPTSIGVAVPPPPATTPPAATATPGTTLGHATGTSPAPIVPQPKQMDQPPDTPPRTPEPSGPTPGRRIAKWSALGLAGVSLGVGIAASVIREGKLADLEEAPNGGCFDDHGRAVDQLGNPVSSCQTALDAAGTARTWQVVGFAGAGVFAATWLVLMLTEPHTASASGGVATTSWICAPTFHRPGGACRIRF
jgi:hypothetical protein